MQGTRVQAESLAHETPRVDTAVQEPYVPDRIKRLRARLLSTPYRLDLERVRCYTKVYKNTEGEPPCLRAAKGLQETLRNMKISIQDDELIVGSKSAKDWGDPIYIEATVNHAHIRLALDVYKSGKTVEEVLSGTGGGGLGVENSAFLKEIASISEDEYRELTEEIIPYWTTRTVEARKVALWRREGVIPGAETQFWYGSPMGWVVTEQPPQGHVTIGIRKVLDMGFEGIGHQAALRLAQAQASWEAGEAEENERLKKQDFWESAQIAAAAVCEFADRYAKLAEQMAQNETGKRRTELLEIAERCRRVPSKPPRNFTEALQSIWMTQVAVLISYGGNSIAAPGRVDQFLYPYYKQDLEAGRITRDKALEMIEEYYIKLATNIYFGPNNVTIGGVDKNGEDAVNEVSYLFLEAHRNLKGLRNGLAVRLHKSTPRDFTIRACEVHRETAGIAFYNDDVVIRDLLEDGYSLEDARDYSIVGCVEPTGTGNNNGYTATNGISLAALLEQALHEGGRYIAGWRRTGVPTPPASSFKTFEDVKAAFAEQVSEAVRQCVRAAYLKDQVIAEWYPLPLLSSTIEGCVESGKDVTRGGAHYNHGCVTNGSLATVANSLAAIRWTVFDQKLLTMADLVKHLRDNFEGAESIRQRLLRAPKYGNDDTLADELAAWVADLYRSEVRKHKFWMGGVHRPCIISVATHIGWGAACGASADGRLAGKPISNGISPANGDERNGLTAVLRSAARVCQVSMSDGTALNVNLNPLTIRTDEGLDKFASLVEAYFALGGRQVQFNPVSKEVLLDAQKHPENYPDLVVKVSGFSFRFIDLPKNVQDDIMARTEFSAT